MLSRLVYAKVFMKVLAAERMNFWTVHEGEGLQGGNIISSCTLTARKCHRDINFSIPAASQNHSIAEDANLQILRAGSV